MITLALDPIAFTVAGVAVPWYALTLLAAVVAVFIVARREASRIGLPRGSLTLAALWAVVGGFIGAKLGHVADWWDYLAAHPGQILRVEGWVIHGALLGALLALWIHARLGGTSFRLLCDVTAAGAPLGQAIGRLGCLIQGCCHGIPAEIPWAVVYVHPRSYAPLGEPRHPAQAYFLLWNLAVFAALRPLRTRLNRPGCLFLTYLALYSVGDFALRFLRPAEPLLWGLQQAQLIGLALLALVLPLLAVTCIRAPKEP